MAEHIPTEQWAQVAELTRGLEFLHLFSSGLAPP
jgi:hypothetical protein